MNRRAVVITSHSGHSSHVAIQWRHDPTPHNCSTKINSAACMTDPTDHQQCAAGQNAGARLVWKTLYVRLVAQWITRFKKLPCYLRIHGLAKLYNAINTSVKQVSISLKRRRNKINLRRLSSTVFQ